MALSGHSGEVRCLHLEGNRLVSGSVDTTIKVWDLDIQPSYSSIGCRVTMVGHTNTVRCVQMSHRKGNFRLCYRLSLNTLHFDPNQNIIANLVRDQLQLTPYIFSSSDRQQIANL